MTIFAEFEAAIAAGDDSVTEALVAQLTVAHERALIELGHLANSEQRWWVARALATVGTLFALPLLRTLAQDKDAGVRTAALMALGQVLNRRSEPLQESAEVQAIFALAGECLADDDGSVRQAAVDMLAQSGAYSLPILAQVLEREHQGARTRAAMALRRMKSMAAAGLLYRCLNDSNYMVHTYAYEGLDELGLLETMLLAV